MASVLLVTLREVTPSAVGSASQASAAAEMLLLAALATSTVAAYPILHMDGALRSRTALDLVSICYLVEDLFNTHVRIAKGGNGGGSYTGNAYAGSGGFYGSGGDATTGNSGDANGGSVSNTGGSIVNFGGSSVGGNGGVSSSGNAFGGHA